MGFVVLGGTSTSLLKLKIVSIGMVLLVSSAVITGILMVSNYGSSSFDESRGTMAVSPELSDFSQEGSNSVMKFGNLTLTVRIVEPEKHMLMTYEMNSQKSTLEFIVSSEESGRYQTSIFIDGQLLSLQVLDSNILAPISIPSPVRSSQPASIEGYSSPSPQYTYAWWNGVKQVTGPSYLIKYHHPDRTYYQIPTFANWGIVGNRANHNQLNHDLSQIAAAGGWSLVCSIIGAALGAMVGGVFGAAAGVLIGGVLGSLIGYFSGAILLDEQGCIFWWFGIAFFNWFKANAWWLVSSPFGWGATIAQFSLTGYLRVGSWTAWDAPGLGNP